MIWGTPIFGNIHINHQFGCLAYQSRSFSTFKLEEEVQEPDTAIMNAIISITPWEFGSILLQQMSQAGSF